DEVRRLLSLHPARLALSEDQLEVSVLRREHVPGRVADHVGHPQRLQPPARARPETEVHGLVLPRPVHVPVGPRVVARERVRAPLPPLAVENPRLEDLLLALRIRGLERRLPLPAGQQVLPVAEPEARLAAIPDPRIPEVALE